MATPDEKTNAQRQPSSVDTGKIHAHLTAKEIENPILSLSYGISFWIVPAISACQTVTATQLGDPSAASFYVSLYTMTVTIAFMVCGANSDLFGRRWFIVTGNVIMFIGFVLRGSAKSNASVLAAMALIGFWRWLFYAPAIAVFFSFSGLCLYCFPPKHPRGLPTEQAFKELDYVGAILFILAAIIILVGIVYTTTLPSNSPKTIGILVSGFACLVACALWETLAPLKQPLTPPHVFTRDRGRELTFPFVVGFVVTMFYYATNVIYPTMIQMFFTDATTDFKYGIVLTLPQNLGLCFGAALLTMFGRKIGHWKWTLTVSVTVMVIFGALLALGNPERNVMMLISVFVSMAGFGWAQYLSIAFIQFGVPQIELGISGGLAGVSRFAGGAIAISVYTTILSNVQSANAARLVPAAATAAGLQDSPVPALLAALPLGAETLAKVPGSNPEIIAAASIAFPQSYVIGLRTAALSSLSFGVCAIIACLFCNDIGHKMDEKIEGFLENEVGAEQSKFH